MDLHLTPRLFVTEPLLAGGSLQINEKQSHYLMNVLRLKIGDSLRLFNGQEGEWHGTLTQITKRSVSIALKAQIRPQISAPELTLYCAPIKKAHFDYMIEKATELGVSNISPTLTSRTQIRDVNTERCRALSIEAAEQSERLTVPTVNSAQTLLAIVANWSQNICPIICAEWGDAMPVHEAFLDIPVLNPTAVFVGPEGGFSHEELTLLHTLPNAHFIRLGPRILRADTAALSALSCWQAICGDWREIVGFSRNK